MGMVGEYSEWSSSDILLSIALASFAANGDLVEYLSDRSRT
jgi:hypothetical protein